MSFRRLKEAAAEKQRWKTFVIKHRDALAEIGMPEQLFREKPAFEHWLMHGHSPLDYSGFTIEQIDRAKREVLIDLVGAYFDAGFGDPGISVLSDVELQRVSADRALRGRCGGATDGITRGSSGRSRGPKGRR